MSETLKETVTVDTLGKWGPKVGDAWYSYSKNFKDQGKVVPGAVLEIETYVADSGKKYINKILNQVEVKPVEKKSVEEKRGKYMPPASRDFDAEARGKTKAMMFAAALQSPSVAAFTTPDDVVAFAKALADAGYSYVFPGESK